MQIIESLLAPLPDGPVRQVFVGAFWTAVVVEADDRLSCGLAATMQNDDHHHGDGRLQYGNSECSGGGVSDVRREHVDQCGHGRKRRGVGQLHGHDTGKCESVDTEGQFGCHQVQELQLGTDHFVFGSNSVRNLD